MCYFFKILKYRSPHQSDLSLPHELSVSPLMWLLQASQICLFAVPWVWVTFPDHGPLFNSVPASGIPFIIKPNSKVGPRCCHLWDVCLSPPCSQDESALLLGSPVCASPLLAACLSPFIDCQLSAGRGLAFLAHQCVPCPRTACQLLTRTLSAKTEQSNK